MVSSNKLPSMERESISLQDNFEEPQQLQLKQKEEARKAQPAAEQSQTFWTLYPGRTSPKS